jgi:hypothetical protein
MKKLAIAAITTLFLCAVGSVAQNKESFTGEITDSQCALLGGHEKMIEKGEDSVQCTRRCVQIGGKYALYDAASKKAYQMDDQKKAEAFAGRKVTVLGSYNGATKTIRVAEIKPAS